jgi:hypothetical protein
VPVFASRKPPCKPPRNDPSAGGVTVNCQLPESEAAVGEGLEEPPPQATKNVATTNIMAASNTPNKPFTTSPDLGDSDL